MSDADLLAHMGTDPQKWAEKFVEQFDDKPVGSPAYGAPDEATMMAWFANALSVGEAAGAAVQRENDMRLAAARQVLLDFERIAEQAEEAGEQPEYGHAMSALEHALNGDPGCSEPEEWLAMRDAALKRQET